MIRPFGYHEAGHYVAARVLGFKTGSLKLKIINVTGAHSGGSVIEPVRSLRNVDDIIGYLEARIQVLFAGALAGSLSHGKLDSDLATKTLQEGDGQNDFAKARELLYLIRNIRFPEAHDEVDAKRGLDEINESLWKKTSVLVEKDQQLICGLGNRLVSELHFEGDEFELNEAELESLPSIRERFPNPSKESV